MAEDSKNESRKVVDQLLDAQGKSIFYSGEIVLDKESGKNFAEHMADADVYRTVDNINELINEALTPIQTTLNTFLSGDPDDNGTIDRLKELVAAIVDNKDNIDALLEAANSDTGIAFIDSAEETPEYNGKIRMVVSEYTASEAEQA